MLAIVLAAVVFAMLRSFTTGIESAATRQLSVQLEEFQGDTACRSAAPAPAAYARCFLESHPVGNGSAVLISVDGRYLASGSDVASLARDPRISHDLSNPPASTVSYNERVSGRTIRVLASPIRSGGAVIGTFVTTSDLGPYLAQRSQVAWLGALEASVALAIGVLSAFFLLRQLLRRIGRITTTADAIGAGEIDNRLNYETDSDEVGQLARTFDSMLDRIDASMRAQRRLLSDVSHQLRTPVTVVRGHLEVLGRSEDADVAELHETLGIVIDELDDMTEMIERLLTLGRAMEPDLLQPERTPLREFTGALIDSVRVLGSQHFELGDVPDISILIDRRQVRGALSNLLDNAVRATPANGRIRLGARVLRDDAIAIGVEDSGRGIPAAQREAALERFARPGARDEDGSGLGLAIARAVAIAHGGEIQIDSSPTLGGARIELVLPLGSEEVPAR